ncbi:MAG: B12-binding domain-containing radical SAM protein [Paludibacter sp.]|nr:B12-binding domain-containing radical SAM protein [Paludibacter sp.]
MKVLLVYPEMPSTMWNMDFLARIRQRKAIYPPLGLLTVAALLPEDWNLQLVDLNIRKLKTSDMIEVDFVFISAMNVQAANTRKLINRCRKFPVKIVAGGPLFTHEYQLFEGVDHFVLNEAELTLPEFLNDLKNGNPQPIYQTDEFCKLEQSPIPRWNLIKKNDYLYGIVQYSRGCPHKCDFCDVTALYGRKQRTKSAAQILNELKKMGNLASFDMLLFADDNLIGNKKLLKEELLPALMKWRAEKQPSVSFATQVSINLVDDEEMMQSMLEAGFRHIFVGIETPVEESLIECGKTQNLKRDLMQSVNQLHAAGFIISGGFILGFDSDTSSVFQKQIDFIQKSGIVIATVNLLKAPFGTDLFERMKSENRLLEILDFDENKMNLIPKMDIEELYEKYRFVLSEIYSPVRIYERSQVFLQTFKNSKVKTSIKGKVKLQDFITLFQVIFYIGICHPSRLYFWKLLFWTQKKQPSHLRLAFLFGVLMYHYCRLFKKFCRFMESAEFRSFIREAKKKQQSLR